jgi:AbrB family looped-hinge helix DNA binding protein
MGDAVLRRVRTADQTTVSNKYQVVIPKAIRERARLHPGERLEVLYRGGAIVLVRAVPREQLMGAFPDLDTTGYREKEDRL